MSKPIAINLYKIDTDAVTTVLGDDTIAVVDIPAKLVDRYNIGKTEDIGNGSQAYTSVATANGSEFAIQNKLTFYKKQQQAVVSHSWTTHFEQAGIDLGNMPTAVPNIVCFVVRGDDLFAITTGSASVVFEPYIDQSFPIELAKRVLNPEVKGGKQQSISGVVQASDIYFRHPTRVNVSTSYQDVWQNLSGTISTAVRQSDDFKDIFGEKRSVSVEVKSSIKISAKVEHPSKLLAMLDWSLRLIAQDLNEEQKNAFSFYDSVRPLTSRKDGIIINKLNDEIARLFLADDDDADISLSHDDTSNFINAESYELKYGGSVYGDGWTSTPSASEVASVINDDRINGASDREQLEKFKLEARYQDDQYKGTSASVMKHLNGEVPLDGKIYYLLNGRWYQVEKTFQDVTDNALREILDTGENTSLSSSGIGLTDYIHDSEGKYNKAQASVDSRIIGDKVLLRNLELADIIGTENNDYIDIIHVKRGFNGSTRDAASQLRNAMNTIENDLNITGQPSLNAYYDELKRNNRIDSLSKPDFIKLFSRKRRYVMAYVTKKEVTSDNLTSFTSSIAKNETVSILGYARQFTKAEMKLVWIEDKTT